jgi:glutathione S-transferase
MLELYQFRFSHYCAKVRWALEHKHIAYRERNLLPGAHRDIVRTLAGKTCLPVLVSENTVVQDSTAIITFLDQRFPEDSLTPKDPDEARLALEWEEYFDEEIGVPLRLWFYHHALPDRRRALRFLLDSQPWRARLMFSVAFPKVRTAMRRAMGIDLAAAERAEARLFAALDRLDSALCGREFLVGKHFSRADLTACALLLPFCRPGESVEEAAEILPDTIVAARAACAHRRFFGWANEMNASWRAATRAIN